jgi:hypothetical protein
MPSVSLAPHLDAINRIIERMTTGEGRSGFPQRWITGIAPPTERSKPLGLTKNHEYPDFEGDAIKATTIDADIDARGAALVIQAPRGGAYVDPQHALPLAINVLGHDRLGASDRIPAVTVGEFTADGEAYAPSSQWERDKNAAWAISYLLGADRFDQRQLERKKHEEEAEAKRKAAYEAHKKESFERAKEAYADAIRDQIAAGIDADSAAKVQAALSAYETARRKFEGLPH